MFQPRVSYARASDGVAIAMNSENDVGKVFSPARPFLKWAGGKRQLLPHLRRFVPKRFGGYLEPFVGSGALFFDLASSGRLDGRAVWLTDTNRDLLGTYCALASDVEAVITALQKHSRLHRRAPHTHYYRVRDKHFNPQRHQLFAAAEPLSIEEYPPTLAAMFIYLNRTGFNGLFRLNASGGYNVPAGRYENPRICDEDNLRAVSDAIKASHVNITHGSFDRVVERAKPGDFIYFDPPYAPLSDTANFTGYTASGFGDDDQRLLQQVAIALAKRGCHVTISNSTAPLIRELYDRNPSAKQAGFVPHKVPARRAINSKVNGRGEIAEYIITNVDRWDIQSGG